MRAALLASTITARAAANFAGQRIRPAHIQGPPGVGKTQMIGQIADDMGVGIRTIHAPLMLVEDFGMPDISHKEVTFKTPGHKFPFVDSADCPEFGFLQVDEVSQADNNQQKIWANLFQERELHGRKLKPGWYIVSTGNRMQDRAGANRILSHFNDRFTTYDFEANLDDWCNWALDHGVRPEVVGFIRWKPGHLSNFKPEMDKCPTPRAWAEGVSPILDVVPDHALFETIRGDVGEGVAAEFQAFLSTYRSLPNPDLIIANPSRHPVPDELHVNFALSGALAHRATTDTIGPILEYATRMAPEFSVLIARDSRKICPDIENTHAYTKWATGPGAKILLNQ